MSQPPTSSDLTKLVQQALNQPIPEKEPMSLQPTRKPSWRDQLVAWLMTKATGLEGGKTGATNGGYWGGITVWDVVKTALTRATSGKAAAAAMFTSEP